MASSTRLVCCLAGISLILALIAAAAVGVLVWRFATVAEALEDLDSCIGESLPDVFPGYFRTAEQQFLFVARFTNVTSPVETYSPKQCRFFCPRKPTPDNKEVTTFTPNDNSSTVAPFNLTELRRSRDVSNVLRDRKVASLRESSLRKKRDVPDGATVLFGPVYHACCQSWRIITTPTSAETLDGSEVELVQNVAGYSQYFISEYFEEESTCENCQCGQPDPFVYSAVYYKDKSARNFRKRFDITSIKLPGCCKCLNI